MAFPDKAFSLALFEQWLKPGKARLCPGLQRFELQQVGFVRKERTNLLEVLAYRFHDGFRGSLVVLLRDLRRMGMEVGDLLSHFIDMGSVQFAISLQRAQQLALRELTHFQHVFDSRAFAAQHGSIGSAGDGQHEIQAFGQTLVKTQFFITEVLATTELGEIKEAEVDRFL